VASIYKAGDAALIRTGSGNQFLTTIWSIVGSWHVLTQPAIASAAAT
jgi:hypothetical protein